VAISVACGLAACSDDDDADSATPTEPPTLEILGFRTSGGVTDADVGELRLPCDRELGVQVGPQTVPGQLDNWLLRPPGTCGSTPNCGYFVASVASKTGDEALSTSSAATTIPMDLRALSAQGDYLVHVELRQGQTGEPFLVDGEPVSAEVTVSFDLETECDGGLGGAGGSATGGMGGLDGMAGMGGLGGLGGFGGGP
jgi:hypothetical protein